VCVLYINMLTDNDLGRYHRQMRVSTYMRIVGFESILGSLSEGKACDLVVSKTFPANRHVGGSSPAEPNLPARTL